MRYSLLSRFQGGLLGSLIGEKLADRQCRPLSFGSQDETHSNWSEIQHACTDSLIRCGQLDLADWLETIQRSRAELLQLEKTASASEAAIAVLPIALYCHDNRENLQAQVRSAAALWLRESEPLEEIFLWADAIALVLREQLNRDRVIEQLLTLVEGNPTTALYSLQQLRTHFERGSPLEQILASGSSRPTAAPSPLALALYCFACTPENFFLCVRRAAQTLPAPPIAAALTGALAGLYNSISGLPPRWRANNSLAKSSKQRAQQLFAAWSGAYQPEHCVSGVRAVAVAGTLQPRSSLKIISHHPFE